jgi:hypothetical protein
MEMIWYYWSAVFRNSLCAARTIRWPFLQNPSLGWAMCFASPCAQYQETECTEDTEKERNGHADADRESWLDAVQSKAR